MSKKAFKNKEEFKNKFLEYIEDCEYSIDRKLPNIAGFCVFADINRDTFYKQEEYYSDTFKKIQDILEDATINSKINDTFKILYLKNKFGYKDKVEQVNTNKNVEITYENYIKKVEAANEY